MKHKFTGMPSLSWLYASLRKHFNRWAIFELDKNSSYLEWLNSEGFDVNQPIFVRGIFCEIRKMPRNIKLRNWSRVHPSGCEITFRFRNVVFYQGDKELILFGGSDKRRFNRKKSLPFWWNEIKLDGRFLTNQGSFNLGQELLLLRDK